MDCANISWRNFDRRFLSKIKLARILQDYYTENLHMIYILNANWIFRGIYAIVKSFISEIVQNKISILSSVDDLKKYFSSENILKEYNGTSYFEYTYLSND
jgi:hypothetical protein